MMQARFMETLLKMKKGKLLKLAFVEDNGFEPMTSTLPV
jgi:hypothetical protein